MWRVRERVSFDMHFQIELLFIKILISALIIRRILPFLHQKKSWRVPGNQNTFALHLQNKSREVSSEVSHGFSDAKHEPSSDFTRQKIHSKHNENKYQINHLARHPELLLVNFPAFWNVCFIIFLETRKHNYIPCCNDNNLIGTTRDLQRWLAMSLSYSKCHVKSSS